MYTVQAGFLFFLCGCLVSSLKEKEALMCSILIALLENRNMYLGCLSIISCNTFQNNNIEYIDTNVR